MLSLGNCKKHSMVRRWEKRVGWKGCQEQTMKSLVS